MRWPAKNLIFPPQNNWGRSSLTDWACRCKRTKTGYSTDAEVLEALADRHPLVQGSGVSRVDETQLPLTWKPS